MGSSREGAKPVQRQWASPPQPCQLSQERLVREVLLGPPPLPAEATAGCQSLSDSAETMCCRDKSPNSESTSYIAEFRALSLEVDFFFNILRLK